MKKILFFIAALVMLSTNIFAQADYFQQETNYKIDVVLDDVTHTLTGNVAIEYTNNATQSLSEIWIHLWGNAYKNQNTAYAKQELRNGSKRFFFSKDDEKGFFSDLAFTVDGQAVTMEFDKQNRDIARVLLAKPLTPGSKIIIATPFKLKIPGSFSRLGHIGESYQITQWYPKPAVFDREGWHQMPYLNQGEFYSEFGSYDVSITLPENYVVGASGVLQTASEIDFLENKIKESKAEFQTKSEDKTTAGGNDFPPSASKKKTIRYKADNVHDFAWFADKRFYVTKEIATLGNGKKVDCYAMFTNFERNLWLKGAAYVKRAVEFYSQNVGDYPYPHATAVQSALSAGGGMEYPMITVIDKARDAKTLDIIITHEVGHNWFYGILASNEREHGWMDEGMNSYYEERYTSQYYTAAAEIKEKKEKQKKFSLGVNLDNQIEEIGYQWFARQALDQPCELHSERFTGINYGLVMYKKTARSMRALEDYVGTPIFDRVMKQYYELWKFKHPQPIDFRNHWTAAIKDKKINWFFDGLINSDENTYAVLRPSKKKATATDIPLVLEHKGLNVPYKISGIKGDKVMATEYVELGSDEKSTEVLFPKGDYDKIVLDYEQNLPMAYRFTDLNQNGKYPSKYFAPKIKAFNLLENRNRPITYGLLPAFAYNHYDKQQIGLLLYSSILPTSANLYSYIMPMYSIAQNNLTGMAGTKYAAYFEHKKIRKWESHVNLRKFSYDYDDDYQAAERYLRLEVGTAIEFAKKDLTTSVSRQLAWRSVLLSRNEIIGISIAEKRYKDSTMASAIHELKYTLKDDNTLAPKTWTVTAQAGRGFSKLFTSYQQKIQMDRRREILSVRAFAGVMLAYNDPEASVAFRTNGQSSFANNDYMYDQLLLARSANEPRFYKPPVGPKEDLRNSGGTFWSQQLFIQDAGLRTLAAPQSSDKWMIGLNVGYQLPLPILVRPYFDIAAYPQTDSNQKTSVKTAWAGGVGLIVIPDIFEIYFPIKTNLNDSFGKRDSYVKRIGFMLNINKLNPYEGARNIKLNF